MVVAHYDKKKLVDSIRQIFNNGFLRRHTTYMPLKGSPVGNYHWTGRVYFNGNLFVTFLCMLLLRRYASEAKVSTYRLKQCRMTPSLRLYVKPLGTAITAIVREHTPVMKLHHWKKNTENAKLETGYLLTLGYLTDLSCWDIHIGEVKCISEMSPITHSLTAHCAHGQHNNSLLSTGNNPHCAQLWWKEQRNKLLRNDFFFFLLSDLL